MEYTIEVNGDPLEKKAQKFIKEVLVNYEKVWQKFIGNNGYGHRADLPGYHDEEARQLFSEHTYTMLESLYSAYRVVQSDFHLTDIGESIDKYLEILDAVVLFYAHVGRARDNIYEAAKKLGLKNMADIERMLNEAYTARHIVLHGKKMPIIFAESQMTIPKLKVSETREGKWDHQDDTLTWDDIDKIPSEELGASFSKMFYPFCAVINTILGYCSDEIDRKLGSKFRLAYSQRTDVTYDSLETSGTTRQHISASYSRPVKK